MRLAGRLKYASPGFASRKSKRYLHLNLGGQVGIRVIGYPLPTCRGMGACTSVLLHALLRHSSTCICMSLSLSRILFVWLVCALGLPLHLGLGEHCPGVPYMEFKTVVFYGRLCLTMQFAKIVCNLLTITFWKVSPFPPLQCWELGRYRAGRQPPNIEEGGKGVLGPVGGGFNIYFQISKFVFRFSFLGPLLSSQGFPIPFSFSPACV